MQYTDPIIARLWPHLAKTTSSPEAEAFTLPPLDAGSRLDKLQAATDKPLAGASPGRDPQAPRTLDPTKLTEVTFHTLTDEESEAVDRARWGDNPPAWLNEPIIWDSDMRWEYALFRAGAQNEPADLFAEVRVGDRVVAKIYNGGSFEKDGDAWFEENGSPFEAGPNLANWRANEIARAVGGEVHRAGTALSAAEWSPPERRPYNRAEFVDFCRDYAARKGLTEIRIGWHRKPTENILAAPQQERALGEPAKMYPDLGDRPRRGQEPMMVV